MSKATFHVGVVITLYNQEGQILLAKRAPFKTHAAGVWENISGAVESGEQPIETLKRELAEELGQKVKYEIGPVYNTFYAKLDNGRDIIGISYLCRYLGGEIELNQEHTSYRWVSLVEATKLTATPGLKAEFAGLGLKYPEIFGSSRVET